MSTIDEYTKLVIRMHHALLKCEFASGQDPNQGHWIQYNEFDETKADLLRSFTGDNGSKTSRDDRLTHFIVHPYYARFKELESFRSVMRYAHENHPDWENIAYRFLCKRMKLSPKDIATERIVRNLRDWLWNLCPIVD